MTNTMTVTKAMTIESAKNAITKEQENCVRNKIATIKGLQYDPKKVKMPVNGKINTLFSAYHAVKGKLYEVNSMYSNNIAYLSGEIMGLEDKDELTKAEKARLALCRADLARARACYNFFTKVQEKACTDVYNTVEDYLYNAYVARFDNEQGYRSAIEKYFAQFELKVDKTLVDFLMKNTGSKSAPIKNYCDFMVTNMSAVQFTKLFIDCILQVMIDKSLLSMKIEKSTLDGSGIITIEDFDGIITIRKPETVKDYEKAFATLNLPKPKREDGKSAKKEDYAKEYRKAKKAGLFAEYNF